MESSGVLEELRLQHEFQICRTERVTGYRAVLRFAGAAAPTSCRCQMPLVLDSSPSEDKLCFCRHPDGES